MILHPGQFALVRTLEVVKVPPEMVGLISIRSEYKFQGLVNVSGFHVDPTFSGNLIFAVPSASARPRQGYPNIPGTLMAQLGGGTITLSQLKRDVEKLHTEVKLFAGLTIALILALIGTILKVVVH
jgi:hypothetical protein